MVQKSLCKEKAGSVDTGAGNAGERPRDERVALPASYCPSCGEKHTTGGCPDFLDDRPDEGDLLPADEWEKES